MQTLGVVIMPAGSVQLGKQSLDYQVEMGHPAMQ